MNSGACEKASQRTEIQMYEPKLCFFISLSPFLCGYGSKSDGTGHISCSSTKTRHRDLARLPMGVLPACGWGLRLGGSAIRGGFVWICMFEAMTSRDIAAVRFCVFFQDFTPRMFDKTQVSIKEMEYLL